MKRLIVVALVAALPGCGGGFTLFITTMPGVVTAPSTITFFYVSGVVTDASSHHALPGCTVIWASSGDPSPSQGHYVVTDENGHYKVEVSGMDGSGGGRLTMKASKAGYREQTRDVAVSDAGSVDFSLSQFVE